MTLENLSLAKNMSARSDVVVVTENAQTEMVVFLDLGAEARIANATVILADCIFWNLY